MLSGLELSERDRMIAERVVKEINARMQFLLDVGLDYLSLNRSAGTLAGGEAQRIRLASPDRQRPGRRALRARRAVDRPAPARQPQADRHARAPARPRQHRDRRRARRGDDPRRRPRRRHRPGRRRARRRDRRTRAPWPAAAEEPEVDHRPVPVGQAVDPGARRCAASRATTGSIVRGAREHNLKNIDVEFPLGLLRRRHRRVGLGQVDARQRHPLPVADAADLPVEGRARSPPHDRGRRAARQGHRHRPVADRAHAALQPGHLHRRVRPHPQAVRQTQEAKVRGYQPGRFSFNVKGGRCEACAGDGTIKIEMHFLPDVYVPCEVCKGARYNRDTLDITFKGKNIAEVLDLLVRGGARVLRQPARHRPAHADARRRRPRLRAPRPARADAVGRRGPAGEAGDRAGQALHRPHHLHPRRAHHRPALRGHPQAAHRAAAGWSTRATPCS